MTPEYTQGIQVPVDGTVWNSSLRRIGAYLSDLGNEFIDCVQAILSPTNAQAPYEKAGRILEMIHDDPSDYSHNVTKDGVGDAVSIDIASDNKQGRAFGRYTQVGSQPGGDGLMVGHEIGGHNQGSDQPLLDTNTSKVLISFVAGEFPGDLPMTAACYIESGASYFHHAIAMRQGAAKNLITLFKAGTNDILFGIDGDGNMTYQGRALVPVQARITDTLGRTSVMTVLTLK